STRPGMSVAPAPSMTGTPGEAAAAPARVPDNAPTITSATRSPSTRTVPAKGSRPVPSRIRTFVIRSPNAPLPSPFLIWASAPFLQVLVFRPHAHDAARARGRGGTADPPPPRCPQRPQPGRGGGSPRGGGAHRRREKRARGGDHRRGPGL